MKMYLLLRSGSEFGTNGTIARKRIAAESTSGRSNNILDAILAPLEYPKAITCCKSNPYIFEALLTKLANSIVRNFKSSKSKTPSAYLRKNRAAIPPSKIFPRGLSIAASEDI